VPYWPGSDEPQNSYQEGARVVSATGWAVLYKDPHAMTRQAGPSGGERRPMKRLLFRAQAYFIGAREIELLSISAWVGVIIGEDHCLPSTGVDYALK